MPEHVAAPGRVEQIYGGGVTNENICNSRYYTLF
jgi:hypothetical protein